MIKQTYIYLNKITMKKSVKTLILHYCDNCRSYYYRKYELSLVYFYEQRLKAAYDFYSPVNELEYE